MGFECAEEERRALGCIRDRWVKVELLEDDEGLRLFDRAVDEHLSDGLPVWTLCQP